PFACAFAFGGLVVLDAQSPLPTPYAVAAAAALAALLGAFARKRALAIESSRLGDLLLGALLVVGAFGAATHLDGSLDGRIYPAVYVAIGLVSAFARPLSTGLVVASAAALEAAIR